MKLQILISFIFFNITPSFGQNIWGVKPDSVKFMTVVDLDTIEDHFENLKPSSFTYFRTYYYPKSSRSFKEITGHYSEGQRSGKWVWFIPPNLPHTEECCQLGPIFNAQYEPDSLILKHVIKKDIIIKYKGMDSIGGTIYPPELKSTRFLLKKGKWKFLDLNENEIHFGHYNYLEEILIWFEEETKIKLWPTTYKTH